MSESVMYDTISGQPIVHGILEGPHVTSRYHVQAAGSADSSEVLGNRVVHRDHVFAVFFFVCRVWMVQRRRCTRAALQYCL